jgi:HD-like signal output (HDOD) protein
VLQRDRLLVHPTAATRVLELLPRPDADRVDLFALVEADPALAASVLRAANAVHLGYARRVGGVRHAVVMLGGSLVASLAAGRVADLVFDVSTPDYPDWLWQHSIVVASGCAVLAPVVGESVDTAYTVGLLHEIGFLLAATNSDPLASNEPAAPQLVAAGADLLRRWNLPDAVVEAVRLHRRSAAALVGNLERLVVAANSLAHELGAAGPDRAMPVLEALRLATSELMSTRRVDDLLVSVEDEVVRRTAVFRER